MPGTPTPRLGLPTTDPSDFISDYPATYDAAVALLDNAAMDFQGTLAERVDVTPFPGAWYWAVDDETFSPDGTPYRHDGITWRMMGGATPDLSGYQLHDDDLDAIAGLGTQAIGRSLLTAADAAAIRGIAGAQQQDADLDALATVVTAAFGRSLLTGANAAAVKALLGVPNVTWSATKPVAPADGDIWFYEDAQGGSFQFRWRQAIARWVYVGGRFIEQRLGGSVSKNGPGGTWGNLSTVFPNLTIPFAGTWQIEFGSRQTANIGFDDGNCAIGPAVNGAASPETNTLGGGIPYSYSATRAAGDTMKLLAEVSDSTTRTWVDPYLRAYPIQLT